MPDAKGRVRHRPAKHVWEALDDNSATVRRASPEERKSRPRGEPKPGRQFEPLIYAKNGMRIEDLPHETGYAKVPEKTKFKKGQCGNPKGRPKGKKNTDTLFKEALDKKITTRTGGKEKKISVREAIVQRSIQKAIEGDIKFLKFVMEKDNGFELQSLMEEMQKEQDEHLDAADEAILDEFIRQIEGESNSKESDDNEEAGHDSASHDGEDDDNT